MDEFPIAIWERLRAQVLEKKGAHLLQYASSRGDPDLRRAIATYLCDYRGARCHPDQIIVTAGTQQAMMISALALVNRGEIAWIEDPGFYQARRVFGFAGATVVPRPIDEEGIILARPPKKASPKIIYVTPSHQFPLGMTMSLARRKALIDFAHARDAYIFEDDHNSEFRFTGPPLPCLQGLDDCGRVIYAGTMSKILYPSLRLGYILAPERLVEPMIKIRAVMDQHSSAIDQATLASFLTEGHFLSHIKRMRKSTRREGNFLSNNSTIRSGNILFFKSRKPGCISWPGSDGKQICHPIIADLCGDRISGHHRSRHALSKRNWLRLLLSDLPPGRGRKFAKVSPSSQRR